MAVVCLQALHQLKAKSEAEEALVKMAASAELRMDQLPSDPLLHVLSYLGYRDLIKYVTETSARPLPRHTADRVAVNTTTTPNQNK